MTRAQRMAWHLRAFASTDLGTFAAARVHALVAETLASTADAGMVYHQPVI